jgi:hypothetical protein
MLLRRIEDRVEVAGAVTSEKNRLGVKILQRNTKRIKFHRKRIISGEASNRE